jgi:aminoglycoside phosphotransferase (APT) family kinase protein
MDERAAAVLALLGDPSARVTSISQLEGGWSRHSYAVELEDPPRNLIVRARPTAPALDTDIVKEYRIYELLAGGPVPVPEVHGIDTSAETPFGGPFFLMDRVRGSSPNIWRRAEREALEHDWEGERRIAADFVENLAAIHAVDAAGVVEAQSFQEQVAYWRGVQHEMQLVRDPVVDGAFEWVASREPDPVPARLVHGDYRIGNCLIHEGRISGVLDWELTHVGDPRFDLAYTALGWYSGNFVYSGSHLLGAVAESDWFHARYTELTGFESDPEVERTMTALGGLILFGILITSVRHFADGRTRDMRMAWSRFVLPTLREDLTRLMAW